MVGKGRGWVVGEGGRGWMEGGREPMVLYDTNTCSRTMSVLIRH